MSTGQYDHQTMDRRHTYSHGCGLSQEEMYRKHFTYEDTAVIPAIKFNHLVTSHIYRKAKAYKMNQDR